MQNKKSFYSLALTAAVAKRWNKFFYRTAKGTIDPDSAWKQQNEQLKHNPIYKLVNFEGGGELVEQYDLGKTPDEQKQLLIDFFDTRIKTACLHETTKLVKEDDYQLWHNKQSHVAKAYMQRKEDHKQKHGDLLRPTMVYKKESEKESDVFTVVSVDAVIKPYVEHEIKWKLEHRGAIGETPLHLLFLNGSEKHIKIAKILLEKYPALALDLYEGVEYYGESCLHFAIIQNNLEAVQVLLDTKMVDLHARARGKFFIPVDIKRGDVKLRKHKFEGYAYYGEYPLSFAASSGNQKIYDLLISGGCDPNKVDRYGNGVLHLAVIHNQPDMYYHALKHPHKPVDANVCNNGGLTPLALAAKLGKINMFDKILEVSSRRYWSYNTVTCSAYPLKSLDTIGLEGKTDWNSALMMIVRGRKDSHLDMVSNHVIHQLLEEKWKKFGRFKFIRLLAAFMVHVICLSVAVYLRPDQATDLRYGTSANDIARYVFECLVVLICFFVLVFAIKEIWLEGISGYWQNLISIPSRIAYVISVILLLLCVIMRFLELYNVEEWFLVFAVPGLWSYLLFFLRNSSQTGPFITIIFRIFRIDMVRFVIIYAIVLLTCALAFFYQFEGENVSAFLTELGTLMTLFQMSVGEFDPELVLLGKYQALTIAMFIFFMIFMHILLLNMLIAMITRTFEKITKQSEKVWRRQWAAMVVTMERSHSKDEKLHFQGSYALSIESNRVTAEGDAEASVDRELKDDGKRALMVVHHQKKSESQRKQDIKQRLMKVSQQAIKESTPAPRFQVKSRTGYSDIIIDAPVEVRPVRRSEHEILTYSDDEQD